MRDSDKRKGRVFLLTLLLSIFICVLSFVAYFLFSGQLPAVQEPAAAQTVQTVTVPEEGESVESEDSESPAEPVRDDESAISGMPQGTPENVEEEVPLHDAGVQQPAVQDGQSEEIEASSGPSQGQGAASGQESPAGQTDVQEPEPDVPGDVSQSTVPALVPSAPEMMDAFTSVDQIIITGSDAPVYDDDFFASFFVQGQDTLQYDDGLYYFMYYIDGEAMGNLEILFQDGSRYMNVSQLSQYLTGLLTDEAWQRLIGSVQGDYVSIEHFQSNGVTVEYDENGFTINMIFSVEDMPERVISLAGNSYSRRSYALSGAAVLEPNFFSWRTSYNLYTSLDWVHDSDLFSYSVSLSTSNYLSFGPVNLDFYYNLGVRNDEFYFNWNNYRFFYDFEDEGIRLSWGNIYGFGLSPQGTPLGIQFEKNYSYGNLDSPYNSHREYLTITEESVVQIVRNGRVIFRRTLQPGNYRLQDFTFETGYNEIDVIVTPVRYVEPDMNLDDPQVREQLDSVSWHQNFNMAYDSQLLAKGETLYGGSVSIGRNQIDAADKDQATGFLLRVSPQYYYDYHFDDVVVSWYQDVGLTDEMTLMSDFSLRLQPERTVADVSLALRKAWVLGTTTLTADTRLDTDYLEDGSDSLPYFYARLDHSFLLDWTVFRGLSTSVSYGNSTYNAGSGDELTFRLSFSGRLGFLNYSASAYLVWEDYDFANPQWRTGASFGVTPFRGFSISGGITASQGFSSTEAGVQITGYLSASISFGGRASASYSTNFTGTSNISSSFAVGSRDSFSVNLSGLDFSDIADHSLNGSWYHSGDLFGLSVRASSYDRYNRTNLSASFSTASFFSGGVFGFSRSVRDNFVLIRPRGSLSGATVQVARSNSGSAQEIRSFLGTSVYTSLSSYQRNNLVVYVTGKDEFADTQTLAYELNPSNRSGYSIRIDVPQEYTVTGIITFDGEIQNTFSSPVYRIERDEAGNASLVDDVSLYLFADQDGRFIISGVEPGDYVFDVSYNDRWYAVHFSVNALEDDTLRVVDFGTIDFSQEGSGLTDFVLDSQGSNADSVEAYLEPYQGRLDLAPVRITDSSTFWNEIFPPLTDEEISQDFAF